MAMPRQRLDQPVTDEELTSARRAEEPRVAAPRSPGLGLLGLLVALLGAWGAIIPFVGPTFGYRADKSGSFAWTAPHALLYLLPGAVAIVFGLVLLGGARFSVGKGLVALVIMACGAWFVLGPAVWPIFSSGAVFGSATSTSARFVNFLGYNLGPGLLLTALGAMVLARPVARGYVADSRAARPRTISPG
jgi:hypothetical protein